MRANRIESIFSDSFRALEETYVVIIERCINNKQKKGKSVRVNVPKRQDEYQDRYTNC